MENLPLISSRDLLEQGEGEPTRWLVEGLFPAGSLVMLAGVPGSFKTFFAYCLSHALAEVEPFLGRNVHSGPVVYLDRENPKSLILERFRQIGVSDNLSVWPLWVNPEPPPLDSSRSNIYSDLTSGIKLLVFDSFRKFHESDENSSEQMAPIMNRLRKFTNQGAVVLILHHSGKSTLYRGSTEILAGVDVAFCIEKVSGKGLPVRLKLECLKHRYIKEPTLDLEFRIDQEGKAIFYDKTIDPEKEKLGKVWGVMCRLKRESGGLPNQSQILKGLKEQHGTGKDAALSLLQEGEGKLWTSEPEGIGKPRRYKPSSVPRWLLRG